MALNEEISALLGRRKKVNAQLTELVTQRAGGHTYRPDVSDVARSFGLRSKTFDDLMFDVQGLLEDIDEELKQLGYTVPFWQRATYRERDD